MATNFSHLKPPQIFSHREVLIQEKGTNGMALTKAVSLPASLNLSYVSDNGTMLMSPSNSIANALNANNNINNNNNTGQIIWNENLAKMEIAVLAIILYMALCGNGLVLGLLKLRFQKLSRMQWFMAHLALADMFVGFFNVLPQLIWDITIEFHGNDFVCRSIKYLQVVAMYVSTYVLIMCAVDRYMSICHPLTSQTLTPNRVHLMIILAWSVSLLFSLPQIFIFSLTETKPGHFNCYGWFYPGWGLKAYVTWMFVSNYAIPLFILAACYGRICHVIWSRVSSKSGYNTIQTSSQRGNNNKKFRLRISFRRMRDQPNGSVVSSDVEDHNNSLMRLGHKPRGHQRNISKSKIKTVKMTLTVVFCYLLCWAPFYFFNMATTFGQVNFEAPYVVLIMLLASLNSCTNPWIYLAFSGRLCPNREMRRTSRSCGQSSHVTSGVDNLESRTRTSFLDLSHSRPAVPARQGSRRSSGSAQQNSHC